MITLLRCGATLLPLLAGSCATLPDTSAYTAATIQVRQATATAGQLADAEIESAGETLADPDAQRSVRDSAAAFSAAWRTTLRSMDAAVAYAESIEAVTQSGNNGAASAKAVASSVSGLATSLGVAVEPAAAAVTDTAAFVYSQIAIIRAKRSLSASLDAADPAILRLETIMSSQIRAARVAYVHAMNAQRRALEADTGIGFYPLQNAALEKEEKAQRLLLDDAVLTPERDGRIPPLKARIAAIVEARAGLADGVSRFRAAAAELAARRRAGLAAFNATDEVIGTWAAAHGRLSASVRDHRPVTLDSLQAAVGDLRQVVQAWRSL